MLCITRAQAAGPWSKTACCAVNGNDCSSNYCVDQTAASDFLFRLQPGEPQRFLPTGTGVDATVYQYVGPGIWPSWGGGDLIMGTDGPPGTGGSCHQGDTYAGSYNEVCGGGYNWGHTDLEVWYPVEKVDHFPGSRILTNST